MTGFLPPTKPVMPQRVGSQAGAQAVQGGLCHLHPWGIKTWEKQLLFHS